MQSPNRRALLRRRLLIGVAVGLLVTVFDVVVFFMVPYIRETTLSKLSTLMEPLLLVTPLAAAGTCLLGYLLTFVFPDHR